MLICGLQKLSLLDYPEKLAATIFTGGCNLRCPFCHNAPIVTRLSQAQTLEESQVLDFLQTRVGKLDGVCITGGEPLLQEGLEAFIRKIHNLGFLVKLDTNGALPEKLAALLETGLVDYVAMDIKNSPEKYALTVGLCGFDPAPVFESAKYLMQSGVPYEFRTTLVKGLHGYADLEKIGHLLCGAKDYYLQNFEDSGELIGFAQNAPRIDMSGFSPAELNCFADILSGYVASVKIRN